MRPIALMLEMLSERAGRLSELQERMIDGRAAGHLQSSARELLYAVRTVIDDAIVVLDGDASGAGQGREPAKAASTGNIFPDGNGGNRSKARSIPITEE